MGKDEGPFEARQTVETCQNSALEGSAIGFYPPLPSTAVYGVREGDAAPAEPETKAVVAVYAAFAALAVVLTVVAACLVVTGWPF